MKVRGPPPRTELRGSGAIQIRTMSTQHHTRASGGVKRTNACILFVSLV